MPSSTPYFSIAASVSPPPARQRERLAARDGIGNGLGALAKLIELEYPDRSIPDDGAGGLENGVEQLGSVRPDVENQLVVGHLPDRPHIGVRRGGDFARDHDIARQRNLGAARPGALEQRT